MSDKIKHLISCVGDTDPCRANRDSALLYIARTERPKYITIIYSERTYKKQEKIEKCINAIAEDYNPEIITYREIIKDEDVYLFDKMYEKLNDIVNEISAKETNREYIFNLSSGTPQMISAFFTLNRIKGHHFKAIQVATPKKGSNAQTGYDSETLTAEELIATNEDQHGTVDEERRKEDQAAKFIQDLLYNQFEKMILNYDYVAAKRFVENNEEYFLNKELINKLENLITSIQKQNILPEIDTFVPSLDVNKDDSKVLSYYAITKMKFERGDYAEVLVRVKSVVEYLCVEYFKKDFKEDFSLSIYQENGKWKLKGIDNYDSLLHLKDEVNLYSLTEVLKCLCPRNKETEYVKTVYKINKTRNTVAHNLNEITKDYIDDLEKAVEATENLMRAVYPSLKSVKLTYFDNFNANILKLIYQN